MIPANSVHLIAAALFILCVRRAFSFIPPSLLRQPVYRAELASGAARELDTDDRGVLLLSSFYGDFEGESFGKDNDPDDEDDDDDEDMDELNDLDVANFRTRMSSMFGQEESSESQIDELISFATSKSAKEKPPKEWATAVDQVTAGTVLLANPSKFCAEFAGQVNAPLLSKFGLSLPPPIDIGPDRRADLLPVLLVVEQDNRGTCRAILLNRRTGYLLGDLEQPGPAGADPTPLLEKFCIQPLWFGGVDNVSSGLEMLHQCPAVVGARKLTEDGLYWGGDPGQAQDAMSDPSLDRVMTGFDFKFFVQCTTFSAGQLEKELKDESFFAAKVSKEVLFKSRDRMGTRRAKPLWTEIMELLDGEYVDVKDKLYGSSNGDTP